MLKRLKKFLNDFNSSRELKRHAPDLREDSSGMNASQLVNLLYSERWERFFWTKQVREEFIGLASAIEKQKPKIVVEIGTNTGGTLFVFAKVAADNARIISIDLPGGMGGGGYPDFKTDFFQSFGGPNQQLHFIRGNSHDAGTYNQLRAILGNDPIDFLFIDGDHSYSGVKKDFELYAPLVKDGGLVAFHDIKNYPEDHWIKVDRFWSEIRGRFDCSEYLDNSVHWGGIGLIVMKK